MGFKDELASFGARIKGLQSSEKTEHIEETDVLAAMIVLNYIKYEKIPDIFLGVAAINMISKYTKQPQSRKIGGQYRIHIDDILKGIEDINQKESIFVGYVSERNDLLIIQFWDFQFSFMYVNYSQQIKNLITNDKLDWDGIKKQPFSKTLFEFALSNNWITNKTIKNEDLRKLIQEEQESYIQGDYKIENGRFVKIKNLKYRSREGTEYEINYLRNKLLECQNRPVILIGKFAKVWDKHVTFTMICPYIKGMATMSVCNHINLYRPDVEKVIDLDRLVKYDRYYIIGYCKKYPHEDRIGVNLAMDLGFSPLIRVQEFKKIPRELFGKCHRFSIEEYMAFCQKEIIL